MPLKRLAEQNWYRLRFEVLRRDNFTCRYCGQSAPNTKLEVDHIVELADGGTNSLDNLVTSCYACNRGKSGAWIYAQRRQWALVPVSPPILSAHLLNHRKQSIPTLILVNLQSGPKTATQLQIIIGCRLTSLQRSLGRLKTNGQLLILPSHRWALSSSSEH